MASISYADFEKVEIRSGRIVRVEPFPKAKKPAYRLWIDFGEFGLKQSSAQITRRYDCPDLLGRTVLAVTNFPPRQVADFISEVLVLGVVGPENDVVLIKPDFEVALGSRVL
ncbi:tRNA-binding protein [Dehalogenimonas formicexedens]|uniref:tRNA-binding protein n=1 Tax=Dehalogenimonas formicexedens TaxID=1839801 RepID=A0A1P8F6C4_9CHLR|nr:tRNA-binding protein [Dehalogenimonas formicexedens]APV43990.1 tRNA-binding protein [Dehalogenimonas formicexedens]